MDSLTPMMNQYTEIKARHRDSILLFRLGDFYEMFGEDAKLASKVLDIALTSREKGKSRVPMCGVPHHAADSYIARLLKNGFKVAVCDQVEDPRQAKGIVKREVTRMITPGTILDINLLDAKANNYLAAVSRSGNERGKDLERGLAYIDASTGEFYTSCFSSDQGLLDEIMRIRPAEIILPESSRDEGFLPGLPSNIKISYAEDWKYSPREGETLLKEHFRVSVLDGYGLTGRQAAVSASAVILQYLRETQKTALAHITRLKYYEPSNFLVIDEATRDNLELVESRDPGAGKKGTLLSALDATVTSMGGRLLKNWILQPLKNIEEIEKRQSVIKEFYDKAVLRKEIRAVLDNCSDIQRVIGRISAGTVLPRELVMLKNSLLRFPELQALLKGAELPSLKFIADMDPAGDAAGLIEKAVSEDAPHLIKDGGIIREGFSEELDGLRAVKKDAKKMLAEMEKSERERTGIQSLKVSFNGVFGYYIEVTRANLQLVPANYIRKQTLVNSERYITPELKDFETTVLNAEDRISRLEYELYGRVKASLLPHIESVMSVSRAIAFLDTTSALAETAKLNGYVRPVITKDGAISITGGRHPVVEKYLSGERFIPNDTRLDGLENRYLIITGPNMAGKSTYIRQVALIVIMAHMGGFVPAAEASVTLTDRIFSRIGASDSISRGQSTFMVEMAETANILNNATADSLIILDEIGRGTSTFDGLSLAWAVSEYINGKIGAKTLFATHYHELTELEMILDGIKNYNIAVKEWNDNIICVRKIVPGGADKSYGIQVARLAGIPGEVLLRAKTVLKNLEAANFDREGKPRIAAGGVFKDNLQLSLLDKSAEPASGAEALEELRGLDPENMTPIEALIKLKEIKQKLGE